MSSNISSILCENSSFAFYFFKNAQEVKKRTCFAEQVETEIIVDSRKKPKIFHEN